MPRRKTYKELGIPRELRNYLPRLQRDLLLGKKYEHRLWPDPTHPAKKRIFNMASWYGYEFHCGTAGCIGGWAERDLGPDVIDSTCPAAANLEALFYPAVPNMRNLTPVEAAQAIENFLQGARRPWAWKENIVKRFYHAVAYSASPFTKFNLLWGR